MLLAGLLPICSDTAQTSILTWEMGQKWALAGGKGPRRGMRVMENLFMDTMGTSEDSIIITDMWTCDNTSEFKSRLSLSLLFEVIDVTSTEYIVEVNIRA